MPEEQAKATPTKAFFVQMLVKDVSLESAILELLDNSLDGAVRSRPSGNYRGLNVSIEVKAAHFLIRDNCGGIDVNLAKDYAFRFGRPAGQATLEHSIGVFGVGMKRAIFKMGKLVTIRSTTRTHTFTVELNVPQWQADDDGTGNWHFPMQVQKLPKRASSSEIGTVIEIKDLFETVRQQFSSVSFAPSLSRQISARHQVAIDNGLAVMVNDTSLMSSSIRFAYQPGMLRPAYEERPLDGVKMRLFAGIGSLERIEAGWNVYCNGRMVVERDQTELTGWGRSVESSIPRMHWQFARFRGCVYFDSPDPSLLPWNTTKDGVDVTSPIYRGAKVRMVSHARAVIDVLNRIDRESDEPDESKRVLTDFVGSAPLIPISQIPISDTLTKFAIEVAAQPRPPAHSRVMIQRLKSELERLKDCVDERSYPDAINAVLDWYMETQCPDGD